MHTHAALKDSLCLQPLPTPATPVFERWKNSRGVRAPCCPNSPGLVRPVAWRSPLAPRLPARRPVPTGSPGVGVGGAPSAAEPCLRSGAAGHPRASLAFLLGSVRSLFRGPRSCLGGFFF